MSRSIAVAFCVASLALALLATSFGCVSRMPGALPASKTAARSARGALSVGVDRADITPSPGFSTAGHGPDARVSRGAWSRLYARSFWLETDAGDAMVIVNADLWAMSTLLQRQVAIRVRDLLPASQIMMVATHTHAGPAHFFDGALYNDLTSTRYPGYSEEVVLMLAERIAASIRRAQSARRPATVRWVRTSVWGLTRNRSLAAHLQNPPAISAQPAKLPYRDDMMAIDPALRVLQFEDKNGGSPAALIGSIAFFSMHPTVLSAQNQLFGGDVMGVAALSVEQRLREARGGDPVHAVVNSNAGDVVPVHTASDRTEVRRIAERLATEIVLAHGEPGASAPTDHWGAREASVPLGLRYLEVDLPSAPLFSGRSGGPLSLCEDATLGMGVILGGADHPSSLVPLLAVDVDVADYDSRDCQAPKVGFVSTASVLVSSLGIPRTVPLALARVGDLWIAFVPAEPTVRAGAAMRRAVLPWATTLDGPAADVVVASIANGYIQYVATREEYQLQQYEGASTLYGPSTSQFLSERFTVLAASMSGDDVDASIPRGAPRIGQVTPFEYAVGPDRERMSFGPPDETPEGRAPIDLCRMSLTLPPRLCFTWWDANPRAVSFRQAPWVRLVNDDAARSPVAGGVRFDDRGSAFATAVGDHAGDLWSWATVYEPREDDWSVLEKLGPLRVQVGGPALPHQGGRSLLPVESPAFLASKPPPICTPKQLAACSF